VNEVGTVKQKGGLGEEDKEKEGRKKEKRRGDKRKWNK
jgi:hypothetical protein